MQINSENIPKPNHHANGRGYPHFYQETHLLSRGDPAQKQEVVSPGLLQVIANKDDQIVHWNLDASQDSTSDFARARLANWLTDQDSVSGHLVARVIVNRVWQHHFGRGIVATPNDFGFQGERPTHSELLDWLAVDLIENGWRLKRLHKLIMTSSVYRQSSAFHEGRAQIDPDNLWLWRRTPLRLEAEAIRDSMYSVAGQLDTTMYGPGTLDTNMKRRSIYFFIKRSKLIPMMMLFDWPEHLVSIGRRQSTTIAPQALMFMNSPQGRNLSESFASRCRSTSLEESVEIAYRLAFQREPTSKERAFSAKFLEQQIQLHDQAGQKSPGQIALADFCQTLFCMNEFIYID